MKKIKLSLLLVIILTAFNVTHAQDTTKNKVSTKKIDNTKSTINSSEKEAKNIKFDKIDYYVIEGMWYTKLKNKYVLRQAPKGAKIDFLPQGGKPVIMGGVRYYKCKGVFYKKNKTDDLYEVARP